MKNLKYTLLPLAAAALVAGCATESHQAIAVQETKSAATKTTYSGPRSPMIVGKFDNRSGFLRGIFSDGTDRLSSQAKTILVAHLQKTGRFAVLDRDNMEELAGEAKLGGKAQKVRSAEYVITGDITEFGRKETGDRQLFGILGSGKKQVAYSKVTLNVVHVETSDVVYSAGGSGEYALDNREVLGFGGTAAYDSTLNGKVIDLAMREAVDRLVEGLERQQWTVSAR